MSFDLIAFLGDGPMSAAEAHAHLDRLRERDEARCREVAAESALPRTRPRPPLDGFYDDLVRRYPDLDELPDAALDRAPWSVGLLGPWDDHIDMCISWPSAREVARFATPLALSHGVHVLDPQLGIVYTPAGRSRTILSSPWLYADVSANAKLLSDLVRSLEGRDEPFLIAELSSEGYMQVLWTQEGWLVEVREGDADHHYQAQGLGRDSAISALVSYDRGENDWRKLNLSQFGSSSRRVPLSG